MTLQAAELEAERMAWSHERDRASLKQVHGYAFRDTAQGRIRVRHIKGSEPKKGQRAYFLNGVEVSRARVAQLLAEPQT